MATIVEDGGLPEPTLEGNIISTKATNDEIDATAGIPTAPDADSIRPPKLCEAKGLSLSE